MEFSHGTIFGRIDISNATHFIAVKLFDLKSQNAYFEHYYYEHFAQQQQQPKKSHRYDENDAPDDNFKMKTCSRMQYYGHSSGFDFMKRLTSDALNHRLESLFPAQMKRHEQLDERKKNEP